MVDKKQILDVLCDFPFVLLMHVGSFMSAFTFRRRSIRSRLAGVTLSDALAGRHDVQNHWEGTGVGQEDQRWNG